jgi:hypothetical protein
VHILNRVVQTSRNNLLESKEICTCRTATRHDSMRCAGLLISLDRTAHSKQDLRPVCCKEINCNTYTAAAITFSTSALAALVPAAPNAIFEGSVSVLLRLTHWCSMRGGLATWVWVSNTLCMHARRPSAVWASWVCR